MARALVVLLALLALAPRPAAQAGAFEAGVEAYRAGDHERAGELWREALDAPLAPEERARVLYDLGNAAWRAGDGGEALGWYNACLRVAPRHADARANRAYVREELGLPPADAGGLLDTLVGALELWTRGEAALAVIATSLLLLGSLLVEAFRGGRAARWAVGASALLVVLAAVPWIHAERRAAGDPWIAIGTPETSLRAEPTTERPAIATLDPGDEVRVIDELGEWRRVRLPDGTRGWAPAEELFRLER